MLEWRQWVAFGTGGLREGFREGLQFVADAAARDPDSNDGGGDDDDECDGGGEYWDHEQGPGFGAGSAGQGFG